jgi:hypothetical protein
MNARTQIAAHDMLTDEACAAVSGGQAERHQVTLQEYERILAKMIAEAKKK